MARASSRRTLSAAKSSGSSGAGFGSRLEAAMRERGWTMGETARRVREQLGDGAKFTPANISHYRRGSSVPRLRYLDPLSAVLGIDKGELMGHMRQGDSPILVDGERNHPAVLGHEVAATQGQSAAPSALHIEDRGSEALIQINQQVSWAVALKVLQALKGKDE